MVEKLFSDPFQKNQNWAYLRINCLKFSFYLCPSLGLAKNRSKGAEHLLLSHTKFLKKTRGFELVFLALFLLDFWRKIFLLLSSITWTNFIAWLPLLHEILGNMWIVIVCWPGCDIIDFKINLTFLIKPSRQTK